MAAIDLLSDIGYATRPLPGETVCGDACGFWWGTDRLVLAVADGLGHGPGAAEAAEMALRCLGSLRDQSCESCFTACDEQLRSTRGVALALAIVEFTPQRLTLATVGNIRAVLLTERRERRLGGARGIVGAGFSGLTPDSVKISPGDSLYLYSDGLAELLPLRQLQATDLRARELAETALQNWALSSDDAAMLVYRH